MGNGFNNNYFGGFGYGGFNQQPCQMPPRQPSYQPPQQMQPNIKGRIVASIDEVRAAPVEFDGSTVFYPCPATQSIYVKYLGLDGNPVIDTFAKSEPPPPKQYAETAELEDLKKRLEMLEQSLKYNGGNAQ